MTDDPLFVTRPMLPPLAEFTAYLEKIWDSRWLTNAGPFHAELELRLAAYLGVEHLSLFANGTLALVTALKALGIKGEVITTPYSFVATAHSLLWSGIQPVFADVDPRTCNLDPTRIEAAITPRTTAILPVHCYGGPCEVEAIEAVARAHGLKVIYDAAHAFGVSYRGRSLLQWGDLSVLSFHATKAFHTFEGGAIICPDLETKQNIDLLKNFGIYDEINIVSAGINAKMNEVQAAMGLLQLRYVDDAIERRGRIDALYRHHLSEVTGVRTLAPPLHSTRNFSYFPIFRRGDNRETRDQLYSRLRNSGIYARRYFYPLISDMPMYRGLPSAAPDNLPNAQSLADGVLCLPIYHDLAPSDAMRVIDRIRD